MLMPSWSDCKSTATKLDISLISRRSAKLRKASRRDRPISISPTTRPNSIAIGVFQYSLTLCSDWSNPKPASAHTLNISRVSGSPLRSVSCRDLTIMRSHRIGNKKQIKIIETPARMLIRLWLRLMIAYAGQMLISINVNRIP